MDAAAAGIVVVLPPTSGGVGGVGGGGDDGGADVVVTAFGTERVVVGVVEASRVNGSCKKADLFGEKQLPNPLNAFLRLLNIIITFHST